MTATNIDIDQFIEILHNIRISTGAKFMNLDMIADDSHPSMNKLVIHPIANKDDVTPPETIPEDYVPKKITNPRINPTDGDINKLFNGLI